MYGKLMPCINESVSNIPKVSIILPTYNRAHFLSRSIESVLRQSFIDFELIVINDGSTDESSLILEKYTDPRIRVFHIEENKGAGYSRNIGLMNARGSFISFQDSDDEWFPEKLEMQVEKLESSDSFVGVVYSDMVWVNRKGETKLMEAPVLKPYRICSPHKSDYQTFRIGIQSVLLKKECVNRVGYFDETLPRFIDLDFLTRLLLNFEFIYIDKPLVKYYSTEGISSNAYSEYRARKMLLAKYAKLLKGNRHFIAYQFFCMGFSLYKSGLAREANKYYLKALISDPLNLKYACHSIALLFGCKFYDSFSNY